MPGALVGAYSVIVQPIVEPMDRFAALDKMYIRQSDMLDTLYPAFVVVGKTNDDAVLACVWIGMDSFTIDIAYRRQIGHEISINVQTQKRCYWGDQIGQKVDQGCTHL